MTTAIVPSEMSSMRDINNSLEHPVFQLISINTSSDEAFLEYFTPFGRDSTSIPKVKENYKKEDEVDTELESLLFFTKDEIFEDGIEGVKVEFFESFIKSFREYSIYSITTFAWSNKIDLETLGEVLLIAGGMEDSNTHECRFQFLVYNLFHDAPSVKDSSIVGLAYLNDKRAIKHMEDLLLAEECEEIIDSVKQVLEILKN